MLRGASTGAWLVGVGTTPFVAGVASNAAGLGDEGAPRLLCPLAEATGVPCPFCGASRAFRLATSGDAAFLHYNPFWVLVATALVIGGLVLLVRRTGSPRTDVAMLPAAPGVARLVAVPVSAVVVLMLGGWCVAMANRDAIIG
ncbi:MAG: DUF2752 domain-containing protein [Solirubrobacteraceae bacterium]|nr:DUF2752 domain-containing protein [Solirubrobacteraceae bacterium]